MPDKQGSMEEAIILKENLIPREAIRPGDRLRGFLSDVQSETRGPQLYITRKAPEFLVALFKLEVPEVGQGLIEILGAARDPGLRAKISVKSNDPKLDAIGACVGMRGSRVQSVSNELGGERKDIIMWDEDPAKFVVNAMSPAEVLSIVVDEEKKIMDIAVSEDQLSQAIGRGGQNVRLASELTGWELNVMSKEEADDKLTEENQKLSSLFMEELNVDQDVADVLAKEGFSSINEIAYCSLEEFNSIEDFDTDIINELRKRALDKLELKKGKLDKDNLLSNIKELSEEDIIKLNSHDINSIDDVADLSVAELLDVVELSEDIAGNSTTSKRSATDKSATSSMLLISWLLSFIMSSSDNSLIFDNKLSLSNLPFLSSNLSNALFLSSFIISVSKSSIELNSSKEQYAISFIDENPSFAKTSATSWSTFNSSINKELSF
jgi:N utilization substance protein A